MSLLFVFPDARLLCQGLLGRLVAPLAELRPTHPDVQFGKKLCVIDDNCPGEWTWGEGWEGTTVLTSSDVCLWSPFAGPPRAPAQGHVRVRVTWCMAHTRLKGHTFHL